MLEGIRYGWALRRLTREWIAYRGFLEKELGNWASGPADEQAFLTLQGKLASRISRVAASAPTGSEFEAPKHFSLMYGLLNRFQSLLLPKALTEPERDEIQSQWHQGFLFLNRLSGAGPAGRQTRAKDVRPGESWAGVSIDRRRRWRIPLVRSVGLLVRLGILAVVFYVIGRTIGFFKATGGHLAFRPPRTMGGAVANFVDGSRDVGAAAGAILRPVVGMYGVEVTLILVGVLILGLAYLIFVRS